jgi:hypothetical protein
MVRGCIPSPPASPQPLCLARQALFRFRPHFTVQKTTRQCNQQGEPTERRHQVNILRTMDDSRPEENRHILIEKGVGSHCKAKDKVCTASRAQQIISVVMAANVIAVICYVLQTWTFSNCNRCNRLRLCRVCQSFGKQLGTQWMRFVFRFHF